MKSLRAVAVAAAMIGSGVLFSSGTANAGVIKPFLTPVTEQAIEENAGVVDAHYTGWRHSHRRWRRRHRNRAIVGGLIGGAIIGGIIANENRKSRRRNRARNASNRHLNWCYAKYRSYRERDNTFKPHRGRRRQCVSPYY